MQQGLPGLLRGRFNDGSQDKDRPVRGSRANGLLIAVLATSALVLSVYCLNHAPDPAMVARWWPATTLITVMLILAPHHARPLAGLAAALIFAATLYAGHDIAFAIGFAIANAVEAMLVLRWLTGFEEERPELRSWSDFRRWLIGITVASLAAGAITAMTIGITRWRRPVASVAVGHRHPPRRTDGRPAVGDGARPDRS